jgi:hypothetical protein
VSILQEPADRDDLGRSRTTEHYIPRKSQRSAAATIGRGALACPRCDVPILPVAPIAISARMRCPFCRTIDSARRFVRVDAFDTGLNRVELRARLPV